MCLWIHTHGSTCHSSSIFYSSSSQRAVFWDKALKWMREVRHRVPRCPDIVVLRGLYHTDVGLVGGQHSSPALPPFTAAGGWMWQPMLPSCWGARPAKPQAHNECHTIVTTCTFMERGGRTSLARTLAAYDETSSINQTIRERAEKHLWNPGRKPLLIYDHFPSKCVQSLNCGKKCHFPNVTTTSVNNALQLQSSVIFPTFLIWISHMLSMNNFPQH